MKLGKPKGAAALRRAGKGGQALRKAVSKNAGDFAESLAPVVEELRHDGVSTLWGIAEALNARDMVTRRDGRWQVSDFRSLLARPKNGQTGSLRE